jgi:predicted SprT family Zn-dependent metalloprotease
MKKGKVLYNRETGAAYTIGQRGRRPQWAIDRINEAEFSLEAARKIIVKSNKTVQRKDYPVEIKAAFQVATDNVLLAWNNRMTSTAGMARYYINRTNHLKIDFSKKLVERATKDQFEDLVLHEFAHLVDVCLRGNTSHDKVWKNISKIAGGSGKRCHSISTKGLERKRTFIILKNTDTGQSVCVSKAAYIKATKHGDYALKACYVPIKEIVYKGHKVVDETML